MHDFLKILGTVSGAMAGIGLTILGGFLFFFIFRSRDWARTAHRYLSLAVIWVLLPLLLFGKLAERDLSELSAPRYSGWQWLPLGSVLLVFTGTMLAWGLGRLFLKTPRVRPLAIAQVGFQNGGYMVFAIVRGVFPEYPVLESFVPLFLLGYTPLLWTVGPMLLHASDRKILPENDGEKSDGESGEKIVTAGFQIPWKKLANPPFLAIVVGFVFMLFRVGPALNHVYLGNDSILDWFRMTALPVADVTVPLSMVVLGGSLARLRFKKPEHPRYLAVLLLGKLVLLPLVAFLVFPRFSGWIAPAVILLWLIESIPPSATNLVVMSRAFAEDETLDTVSEGMLYVYAVSLITITIWLVIIKAYFIF